MDLGIKGRLFIVTGASAGLGYAVAKRLLNENASIVAVARTIDSLEELAIKHPGQLTIISGDVREEQTYHAILEAVEGKSLDGIFVNAGGPPAMMAAETKMEDWDAGYELVVRWKIRLVLGLLDKFTSNTYGRILFSESSSVRQPVENLVLSNSLRLAVVGFSKSLSAEHAHQGVNVNVIAPGFHETAAVDRLFKKKMELEGITYEEARAENQKRIPSGKIGQTDDFASLAAWLLSPLSDFVTGQVYALDGGAIKGTL